MKKEKKLKVTPTQEGLDKMVLDYLNNSSKHVFQTKNVWESEFKENYYKVIPLLINGKQSYFEISFSVKDSKIDSVYAKKRDVLVTSKKYFGDFKNSVFPQYKKHKSVRQSEKLKDKFKQIQDFVLISQDISEIEFTITKILRAEN